MYDWQKVLVAPSATLQEVVEIIESEALRVALVVDSKKMLLGVVTDGDIRRALIRRKTMDTAISEVMNVYPKCAKTSDDSESLLAIMESEGLLHMPIVDEAGVLTGLELYQKLSKRSYHENAVFIMAGGFGTRLRPMTESVPKPMLFLGNQPVLENIIKLFIAYRFRKFYISVHYLSEQIMEYFGDGSKWGVNIQYLEEKSPLGTAGSLSLLPEEAKKLPILVMNADILTKINFENLLHFHSQQAEAMATVCVREYDFQVPYGVIESDGQQVVSIREKPVHHFFVNAGIYVLNPAILQFVEKNVYLDMPTLLDKALSNKHRIPMFPVHEYWLDIGKMDDFTRANNDYRQHFERV